MNCKFFKASLFAAGVALLTACGGGGVSSFDQGDQAPPLVGGIDENGQLLPPNSDTSGDVDTGELPDIDAGNPQHSDPNVLVFLRGVVSAAQGANIERMVWRQLSGPTVTIASPTSATTSIVAPDVETTQSLGFQFIAQDSEGRVNSATTLLIVKPSEAFARVVGASTEEGEDNVNFTVELEQAAAETLTVAYRTVDGTALAGVDFVATSGNVEIPVGEKSIAIQVPLLAADSDEESESFALQITVTGSDGVSQSNAGAVIIKDISSDEALDPPALMVAEPLVARTGEAINYLLANSGGGEISECSVEPALPEGLSLSIREDSATCVLTGSRPEPLEARNYSITATNASGSDTVTLSLSIESGLQVPDLVVEGALNLVVGQAVDINFANQGGGSLTSCTVQPALPTGLVLTLDSEQQSCLLSGTPSAVAELQTYSLTAANEAGGASVDLNLAVASSLTAPELQAAVLNSVVAQGITPLVMVNNGGGDLTDCRVDAELSLPNGLTLDVAESGATCVISGTPIALADGLVVPITAVNAAGDSTAAVTFNILPAAPNITDRVAVLVRGSTVNEVIENTAGGQITSCTVTPALPEGLSFATTEDASTCVLTGRAIAVSEVQTYVMSATNAAGSSSANLELSIVSDLTAPELAVEGAISLNVGELAEINFENTGGGTITSCTILPALPEGLFFTQDSEEQSCMLSGTPSAPAEPTTYRLTATNEAGSGTVTATIEINRVIAPPVIESPGLLSFTRLETIETILLSDGQQTPLTACTVVDPLPPGLSFALGEGEAGGTCILSGTPSEVSDVQEYRVSVSNAVGTTALTFNISVAQIVFANTISIPVTSDIMEGSLAISSGIVQIDWGDGNDPLEITPSASTDFDYNFIESSSEVVQINFSGSLDALTIFRLSNGASQPLNVSLLAGAENLRWLQVESVTGTTEEIAQLFPNLELIATASNGSGGITGSTDLLPASITSLELEQPSDALTGPVSALPRGLTQLELRGKGHNLNGNVSEIPASLTLLTLSGAAHAQLSGGLEDLPLSVLSVVLSGTTGISANLDLLSAESALQTLFLEGQGINVQFDVAALPQRLSTLNINNTTSSFEGEGGEEPTITGDIAEMPNIRSFYINSENAVSGDLANLPSGVVNFTLNGGSNTISGSVQDIPVGMNILSLQGLNTVTGSLTEMTQNALVNLSIAGRNTITWDGAPNAWQPDALRIFELSDNGDFLDSKHYFTRTQTDEVLNFLAPFISDGVNTRVVIDRVGDQPRTTASDEAVQSLEASGTVVTPIFDAT